MRRIILRIDGMTCSMCESHVNDTLRRAFKLKKVSSSHTKVKTVILSEQDILREEIEAALEPTGYRLLAYESQPYERKGLFLKG